MVYLALSRAERLQLEAAQDKLNWLFQNDQNFTSAQRTAVAYIAARLEKVLTGHSKYR